MNVGRLFIRSSGLGLLLLSGCDVARSARDDLLKLTNSSPPPASQARRAQTTNGPAVAAKAPATVRGGTTATVEASAAASPSTGDSVMAAAATPSADAPTLPLMGKTESEVRAMLGPPTSEETHPPGKQWRYRDGKCTLDVQLYPNVESKQFGTLAYKVKSDDNTAEGNRVCLAQLQSRAQVQR